MKTHATKFITTLVLVLAGTGANGGTAAAGVSPDEVLGTWRLTSLDGEKITLSSYRGEVVVVNFWASWCAPCRRELPLMSGWNDAWADRGARVVAISIDKEERNIRRFLEDHEVSVTIVHDGPDGLARKLDLPSLPCTYVLDRDGKIVRTVRSSSDDDLALVRSTVESLLAARPRAQEAGMNPGNGAADAPPDGGMK